MQFYWEYFPAMPSVGAILEGKLKHVTKHNTNQMYRYWDSFILIREQPKPWIKSKIRIIKSIFPLTSPHFLLTIN